MSNWVNCPNSAYKNQRVEVTATTDDPSITRVDFNWTGAITHFERVDSQWRTFTSSTYATDEEGKVDVTATFYDEAGNRIDQQSCYFYVQ